MAIGRGTEEKYRIKNKNNNNRTKERIEVTHNRWIF
jgi:hypothetical protein